MGMTANQIALKFGGQVYDEAKLAADAYPGMLLEHTATVVTGNTQPPNIQPHSVLGGGGELMVCREDSLRGGDITQKILSGSVAPFFRPRPGDVMLMLLKNGQNVPANSALMSAGDGTLIVSTYGRNYQIQAPSTVITNTNVETAFSNGSYTFAANTLRVGDIVRVRAKVFAVAENGTDTHRIRLYFGATPITIADSAARQLAAGDVVIIDAYIKVRTITAAGTLIADGVIYYSVSGTFSTLPFTVASTAWDSTVANPLVIKSLASATSAGNQVRLDEFEVSTERQTGVGGLQVYTQEACDNSIGAGSSPISGFSSAAFVRCRVK